MAGFHGGVARVPAEAPGAQFRVGGGGDGKHSGFAEEVERVIQDVDADVRQGAAAGKLGVGEPAAKHGYPGAAEPGRLGVVRTAELAVVHDGLEFLDVAAAAVVEGDVKDAAGFAGGVHHGPAFFTVAGQRLLA